MLIEAGNRVRQPYRSDKGREAGVMKLAKGHIGITGSAGIGKTTLATALAARLGSHLVPEVMRDRLVAGFDLHQLTRQGHRALLLGDATDLARRLATADSSLVTDRTPLDMAAFWLSNGYGVDDPAATEALLARAICAMADYCRVILLPWGVLPLADDGVRVANPWLQLHFHEIIAGLCRRYLPTDRLLIMPESASGVPDRLDWVLRQLEPD
jgi:nicotinamide riboside kinase